MDYKVGVLFVFIAVYMTKIYCYQNNTNDQSYRKKLIESLFLDYDNRLAPSSPEEGPTDVTVQIFIISIDTISETNMDFSLSMFLRQSWFDSRLTYTPVEGHMAIFQLLCWGIPKVPLCALFQARDGTREEPLSFRIPGGMRTLELDTNSISKVWIPDLFIPTEKKAIVHHVTVPNKLMHVYPDGRIQYSLRISATIKCNFDLRKFPMDSQHCFVEMESYGYTTDTIRFKWDEKSISSADDIKIPQFYLDDLTTEQCDKVYYGVGYSCVRFDFYMQRSVGYYVTQVFIPSYLIVFLSWVSFWLDIDAVPARISLGLLTVLTMTTQSAGARNNLPKVSYLKGIKEVINLTCTDSCTAIDVWMAVCLGFVFLGLVEFAYVNVLARVEKRRKTTTIGSIAVGTLMANVAAKKLNTASKKDPEKAENAEQKEASKGKEKPKFLRNLSLGNILNADREKARNVDRVSRILFPVSFLVFNLVYWFTYVFWEPKKD